MPAIPASQPFPRKIKLFMSRKIHVNVKRMTEIFRTLNLLLKFIGCDWWAKKKHKLANYLHDSHYYAERTRFHHQMQGIEISPFRSLLHPALGFRGFLCTNSFSYISSMPSSFSTYPWNKISFVVVQQSENWNNSNKMKLLRRKFPK